MATFSSYTSPWHTGETKENLRDKLELIAQMETPFFSSIGRGTTTTRSPQLIQDTISAASKNAAVEGAVFVDADATTQAEGDSRIDFYTQIFRDDMVVTGSEEATDAVRYQGKGRMAEQLALHVMKQKRDIEFALVSADTETNKPGAGAGSAGSATTARGLKSYWNQIATDTSQAAAGNVDGDNTNFEDAINDASRKLYEEGGLSYNMGNAFVKNANMMIMSAAKKQVLDERLDAKSNMRRDIGGMGSVLGVSFTKYGSSFGDFAIVPDIHCDDAQAAMYNPQNWTWVSLRDRQFKTYENGRNGDAVRKLVITEGCAIHRNTHASAKLTGLNG